MAPDRMTFLYNDVFRDATITAYSEVATLGPENLQNPLVDLTYRSTDDDNNQWIKFDCGAAVAVNCVALINHNLSTAANNLIIEANATDSWGAPSFTATVSAWESGVTDCGTKTIVRKIYLSATQTYRYWRIRPQEGGSNPDGYIEIGRIMAGVYFESPVMMNYGWTQKRADLSTKKKLGSYSSTNRLYKQNQVNFGVEFVSDADRKTFFTMFEAVGISEAIVVCFDQSAAQNRSDFTFYGELEESPAWAQTFHNQNSAAFVFFECVGDGSVVTITAARGVFGGGHDGSLSNVLEFVQIASTGNGSDFGDLTLARDYLSACASAVRAVFGGGYTGSTSSVIDYTTIATLGNALDFGDLISARMNLAACASATKGVFVGGYISSNSNLIEYIIIASTGNATDFSDLTLARQYLSACASSVRGIFAGGTDGTLISSIAVNIIDFIVFSTVANATDFGDLSVSRAALFACASAVFGLFAGGYVKDEIEYIMLASEGNATDFGDLTDARAYGGACASATRGVFAGGNTGSGRTNIIDYTDMSALGNAVDFGDLTAQKYYLAACANQGGL